MIGRLAGLAYNLVAIFFVISVFAAPVVVLVQRCRAHSKRLFVDEPLARIKGLHADNRIDHRWDA